MKRLHQLLLVLITSCTCYFATAQNNACSAAFTYNTDYNRTVKFISTDSSATTHRWLFGDGTQALITHDQTIVHQYLHAGSYEVKHFVEKQGTTCKDSVVKKIIIVESDSCHLEVKYSYRQDSNNCRKIYFINLSTLASNGHFIWKFGDGTSSNDIAPSHTYTQPGKYYVCLVNETTAGCRKEYCDSIKVICENDCNISAKFEWKKDSVNCKTIHFINQSLPVSSNAHFIWKFGDGTSSTDITPVHTYPQTGKYFVCLVSETGNGCRKEYCDSIKVNCENACNITADFSHKNLTTSPLTVQFEAIHKSSTVKYQWDFGDGTIADSRSPLHLYQQPGKYSVCLSVKDGDCAVKKCESILAGANCDTVKLRYEYSSLPNNSNEINFKAICNEALLSQTWRITRINNDMTLGSVVTLQANNPNYTFRDTGWYIVCLNALSVSSCKKEYCEKLHITSVTNGRTGPVISPNPAINNISFEIKLEKPEQLLIRIRDANGSVRAEYHKSGVAGSNRFTLPVENLQPGIYILQINSGSQMWISRFQKG